MEVMVSVSRVWTKASKNVPAGTAVAGTHPGEFAYYENSNE